MVVTIHQPEHLVWLGLLAKIAASDVFVILDDVQFEKNYFQNRNKIRTREGSQWLTVPIKKHSLHTEIKDIEIVPSPTWKKKYLQNINQFYQKSPYFNTYYPIISGIIEKPHIKLIDLNSELLFTFLNIFDINSKKILYSSEIHYTRSPHEQAVLSICKALDPKPETYLSGPSGRDYLEIKPFEEAGINIQYYDFHHPVYKQSFTPFLPYMSCIDLLFQAGPEARNILFSQN